METWWGENYDRNVDLKSITCSKEIDPTKMMYSSFVYNKPYVWEESYVSENKTCFETHLGKITRNKKKVILFFEFTIVHRGCEQWLSKSIHLVLRPATMVKQDFFNHANMCWNTNSTRSGTVVSLNILYFFLKNWRKKPKRFNYSEVNPALQTGTFWAYWRK